MKRRPLVGGTAHSSEIVRNSMLEPVGELRVRALDPSDVAAGG
ncbi:hypothetical protein Q5H94_05350 [Sphingomonas sp. CA1-15]|uniref:Uncharacterized protein n=1 Tax=Sphingomonas immobilis TaxID=3063997 RepID=A0ABT8ZX68_9SPHN|nr:hypothetical protein [Sphingomonas sp. CA1-15]